RARAAAVSPARARRSQREIRSDVLLNLTCVGGPLFVTMVRQRFVTPVPKGAALAMQVPMAELWHATKNETRPVSQDSPRAARAPGSPRRLVSASHLASIRIGAHRCTDSGRLIQTGQRQGEGGVDGHRPAVGPG